MYTNDPFSTDIADLTRLEREARRERAAFIAQMLGAGFQAMAQFFTARRTAS
jgi:hypothetical protein